MSNYAYNMNSNLANMGGQGPQTGANDQSFSPKKDEFIIEKKLTGFN